MVPQIHLLASLPSYSFISYNKASTLLISIVVQKHKDLYTQIYASVLIKMMATNNYAMVVKTFYNKTVEMSTFTSDDFRKMKLDKRLKGESRNKIGGFFRYMHLGGFTVKAGKSVPSKIGTSHERKIGVWKWSKKIDKLIIC
jgi:hypothetical protein